MQIIICTECLCAVFPLAHCYGAAFKLKQHKQMQMIWVVLISAAHGKYQIRLQIRLVENIN